LFGVVWVFVDTRSRRGGAFAIYNAAVERKM